MKLVKVLLVAVSLVIFTSLAQAGHVGGGHSGGGFHGGGFHGGGFHGGYGFRGFYGSSFYGSSFTPSFYSSSFYSSYYPSYQTFYYVSPPPPPVIVQPSYTVLQSPAPQFQPPVEQRVDYSAQVGSETLLSPATLTYLQTLQPDECYSFLRRTYSTDVADGLYTRNFGTITPAFRNQFRNFRGGHGHPHHGNPGHYRH